MTRFGFTNHWDLYIPTDIPLTSVSRGLLGDGGRRPGGRGTDFHQTDKGYVYLFGTR